MKVYGEKITEYRAKLAGLDKDLNEISTFRAIVFLAFVIFIPIIASKGLIVLLIISVPLFIIGFVSLIRRYNRVVFKKRHTSFLMEINETEMLRQENKLSDFPTGLDFLTRDHPYVSDLDIFGPHSLFQLINRCTTESGNICLAEWLSQPASKAEILKRQEAVQELSESLEWRQDFQASGMHFKNTRSNYKKLFVWIEKPFRLLTSKSKYLIAAILLAILSTTSGVYYFVHAFESDWYSYLLPLSIILVINYLLFRKVKPIAEEIIENTLDNIKILGGYHALVVKIESGKFNSEILKQLQSDLRRDNYSAASEIKKLKEILQVFEMRGSKTNIMGGNKFYPVMNLFWLLDIHWIILSEKWKAKNGAYLESWATAVSEFEAICSLAGFAYSNPTFTFPEIIEQPHFIHFEMLGHPLIANDKRVCNDFELNGRGKTAMITGSNMAGKSTFLRSVGINLALALVGAPCCAKSGRVSHMKIFTSMRTQDNLEEGISSFYAELRRIEQLLKLVESGEAIFFMLDEMFKGTNSKDRHKGGFSLIKQLKELSAFGVISTHDLELAVLAENHKIVTNYSFNSEIQEGNMVFSYKLTDGLCKDFNASELMKRSGINILPNIPEHPV